MNQANTVCLIAIVLMLAKLASILCFGLNPYHLGGWGPAMLIAGLPVVSYCLGRMYSVTAPI